METFIILLKVIGIIPIAIIGITLSVIQYILSYIAIGIDYVNKDMLKFCMKEINKFIDIINK